MSGHFDFSRCRLLGVLAIGLLAVDSGAYGAEIRWLPVTASDNVICTPGIGDCGETQLTLSAGDVTVTLFLEVSGWDPDRDGNPTLGAYQGMVDSSTFRGAARENPDTIFGLNLVPVGAPTGMGFEGAFHQRAVCASDYFDPVGTFDRLSPCQTYDDCPPATPFCVERPDYVFYQLDNTPTVSTASADYTWSAASSDCATDPDDGETKFYGGTLLLDVPSGALGTYNVGFVASSDFTLFDTCPGALIPGLTMTPAQITILQSRCCYGFGTPEAGCADGVGRGDCKAMPAPRLYESSKSCAEGCAVREVVESTPVDQGTLWRLQNNVARITFDGGLPSTPVPGDVEIVELRKGGGFGLDLSAGFTFSVETNVHGASTILRIQDTSASLEHGTWYAIRNIGGWGAVSEFEVQYLLQIGDVDGNGMVISLDVGAINKGIPCFFDCGDDNRLDVDGDGRVISLDVGAVNEHIGSFLVDKPSGH